MHHYRLKPHVRACRDGATIVFLDLREDRYRSVSANSSPLIAGLTEDLGDREVQAERLCALGLIEPCVSRDVVSTPRARAPERQLAPTERVEPTVLDVIQFGSACLGAAHAVASRRLDRTLSKLQKQKSRVEPVEPVTADQKLVVGCFEALRPWYPRPRVCLFDSLALMRFMLAHGLAPDLVLGVRTAPFAAHCWLELDGQLVGDRSDHCASFTPIAWV